MGFAYDLSPPIGHRAAFGLIALQSDETLEPEVTPMLSGDGAGALCHARAKRARSYR